MALNVSKIDLTSDSICTEFFSLLDKGRAQLWSTDKYTRYNCDQTRTTNCMVLYFEEWESETKVETEFNECSYRGSLYKTYLGL